MPTVLIVEDEPAAGRYLRSVFELRRPEFTVVGVELIAVLKREFPRLPAIIVSGHQEFEYARRALDTGLVLVGLRRFRVLLRRRRSADRGVGDLEALRPGSGIRIFGVLRRAILAR